MNFSHGTPKLQEELLWNPRATVKEMSQLPSSAADTWTVLAVHDQILLPDHYKPAKTQPTYDSNFTTKIPYKSARSISTLNSHDLLSFLFFFLDSKETEAQRYYLKNTPADLSRKSIPGNSFPKRTSELSGATKRYHDEKYGIVGDTITDLMQDSALDCNRIVTHYQLPLHIAINA